MLISNQEIMADARSQLEGKWGAVVLVAFIFLLISILVETIPKIGEIIGGSQREDDYDKLVARIEESGLNLDNYWWYLDLRRYGSAPHAGFGLGFERLIQFVTGMANIRDVIPFPRTPGSAEF